MRSVWPVLVCVGCGGSLTPLVDVTPDEDTTGTDAPLLDTGTKTNTTIGPLDTVDTGTGTGWTCPDDALAASGPTNGTTVGMGNDDSGSCGGGASADLHLAFTATRTASYRFDLAGTGYDSVLYVLDGCSGPELACQDVAGAEQIVLPLAAGQQVIVVVDGASAADEGAFQLTATEVPGTETSCGNGIDDDLDGLRDCADSDCTGTAACTEQCNNGTDDDLDGLTDCADADCAGAAACAEVCTDSVDNDFDGYTYCTDPDCIGAAACTETCGNGIDDDVDALVDCLDPDCGTGAQCAAACSDGALSAPLPDTIADNTNIAAGNDFTPSCAMSNASDLEFTFVAPATGTYTFDTLGSAFDTILHARDGCAGIELACNDDINPGINRQSLIQLNLTVGERVLIVVDGWSTQSGPMQLTVY